MPSREPCNARRMAASDVEQVLCWRNHPDVRRHMMSQHEITPQEHGAWFERASHDPARAILIVEDAGRPIGFVQFSGVRPGGVGDWGFYAVPGAPKGSGRKLGAAALDLAFGELGLHKVCGQALTRNAGSMGLHIALGFRQEGLLVEQVLVDGQYQDLACFGLLDRDWLLARKKDHA